MDTAQWPQEIVVKPIEEIVVVTNNTCPKPPPASGGADQRKPRPQKEQALNCPRCRSTNTKFCYYNNYSLTQPRYFCKTCRRYWTEGGSLRNIPVGGGSRKNKRPPSSCPSSEPPPPPPHKNIKLPDHQGQDLNLGYRNISELVQQNHNNNNNGSVSASSSSSTTTTVSTSQQQQHHFSAMELLNGITSSGSRGLHPNFMHVHVPVHPDPNTLFTCGFPIQDFKPSLNFSLDGIGSTTGFASLHHQETSDGGGAGGRLLFPFEDLKQVSSAAATANANATTTMDHSSDKEQERDHSNGYWTGMLGGGGGSW